MLRDGTCGPQSWIISFSVPCCRRNPYDFNRKRNPRIFYWENPEPLDDELFRELTHYAVQAYLGRDLVALCDLLFWPETAVDRFFSNHEQWNDLCGVEILNFEADLYLAKEHGIHFETAGGRLLYLNIDITEEVDPQNLLRRVLCKELTPEEGRSLLSETEAIKNYRGFATSTRSCCSTADRELVSETEQHASVDQRNCRHDGQNDFVLESQNTGNLHFVAEAGEPVPGIVPNEHARGFPQNSDDSKSARDSSSNMSRDHSPATYSAGGNDCGKKIPSISGTTQELNTFMRMRDRRDDVSRRTCSRANDEGKTTFSTRGFKEQDENRESVSLEPTLPPGSNDVSIRYNPSNRGSGSYSTVSCTTGDYEEQNQNRWEGSISDSWSTTAPTSSDVNIIESSKNNRPGSFENKDHSCGVTCPSARRNECFFSLESKTRSSNAEHYSGTELVATPKAEDAQIAWDNYRTSEEKTEHYHNIDDYDTFYSVGTESEDDFESCEEDIDDDGKLKTAYRAVEPANTAASGTAATVDDEDNRNGNTVGCVSGAGSGNNNATGGGGCGVGVGENSDAISSGREGVIGIVCGGVSGCDSARGHFNSGEDDSSDTDDETEGHNRARTKSLRHDATSDGSNMTDNRKTDYNAGCVNQKENVESALTEDEDQNYQEKENTETRPFSKYIFDRLFGFRQIDKSKHGTKRKFHATISKNKNNKNETRDFLTSTRPSKQLRKDCDDCKDKCKEEMFECDEAGECSTQEYDPISTTIEMNDTDACANTFEDSCPTGSCCDEGIFCDCSVTAETDTIKTAVLESLQPQLTVVIMGITAISVGFFNIVAFTMVMSCKTS